jgi:hypothetical protein
MFSLLVLMYMLEPIYCAYETFLTIWREKFTSVWLAGDTLCTLCFKYNTIVTQTAITDYGMIVLIKYDYIY